MEENSDVDIMAEEEPAPSQVERPVLRREVQLPKLPDEFECRFMQAKLD